MSSADMSPSSEPSASDKDPVDIERSCDLVLSTPTFAAEVGSEESGGNASVSEVCVGRSYCDNGKRRRNL